MYPTIILCFVNVDFFSISMNSEFTSFSWSFEFWIMLWFVGVRSLLISCCEDLCIYKHTPPPLAFGLNVCSNYNYSNTFLERSFIYTAPCEWNKLSKYIRTSTFDSFRKSVKTMLFTQQYGCWVKIVDILLLFRL